MRRLMFFVALAAAAPAAQACEFHGGAFGPFAGMYGRGMDGAEAEPAAETPLPDRDQAMAAARAAFLARFKAEPVADASAKDSEASDAATAPSVIAHN